MASESEIQSVLKKLDSFSFEDAAKKYNSQKEGVRAVIKLLVTERGRLTAGEISEKICISTARVAVLLKKMEAKGLITKKKSETDARVTIVEITKKGSDYADELRNSFIEILNAVIDNVGMQRMENFFIVAKEIKNQIRISDEKMKL